MYSRGICTPSFLRGALGKTLLTWTEARPGYSVTIPVNAH